MRKKFIALVLIVVFVFTVTGCGSIRTVEGPDLKKPVFVKELLYTDEMNVDLSYIQDYNWDKEISKVSIVDGPKGVTCKVYDNEEYQEDEKYTLITVHLGINSNRTDDEGNLPEDIAFNKVNITWDDGSESIEDVGSIVISSDDFDSDMVDESGGSEMGESYISLEPAERDVKITGLKFRVKDAEQYFTDITFNETPLKEISIRRPLELYEGESTDISVNTGSNMDYGNISVAADVMEKTEKGEKVYTTIFLGWNLWSDGTIRAYLKSVLD